MSSLQTSFRLALGAAAVLASGLALGQGAPHVVMIRDDDGGSAYRSVLVSLPVASLSHEMTGHVEFNIQAKAAVALEAMISGPHQEMDPKEQQQTGESMVAQTKAFAILVSKYSQPGRMMGFYWSLGLGYRQEQVKWRAAPDLSDPDQQQLMLTDQGQMLNHDVMMSGATGHARAGYRYVGIEVPLEIGAYVGARHFQASVKDIEKTDNTIAGDGLAYEEPTDRERQRLIRRFETEPEIAVEVGFSF